MMALLLKFLLVLFAVAPQNSGVIEGRVTRFGTTDGLEGVSITITRDGQQELFGEPDALTDASGHFIIRNAAPGPYTIRAARPGYVAPLKDGAPIENASAREIRVDLAQPLKNIDFVLTPGGVLAGRVYDLLGRPAENAMVEAILVEGDASSTNREIRNAQSDDRGQFRIFGLNAGKYKLSVDFRRGMGRGFSLLSLQENVLKTYYPGTLEASSAALVDVPLGAVVDGLDFGFRSAQAFKISGTVVDPDRAKRSGSPDFYLIPLGVNDGKIMEPPRMAQNNRGMIFVAGQRDPGAFELLGVQAGRYILYAEDWSMSPLRDNFVVAQVVVDVASDLRDLTLVMTGTSVVEGVVRRADQQPVRNARVMLIPPEAQRVHPMFFKEEKTDGSGKFTVKGVMPGDYTIYAIDPADFKDVPPPASVYAMPDFLNTYAQQGNAVQTRAEEKLNLTISPIRR
jgi:hypothetical protein